MIKQGFFLACFGAGQNPVLQGLLLPSFFQAPGTGYIFLVSGFLYYIFSLFIKLAEQNNAGGKVPPEQKPQI